MDDFYAARTANMTALPWSNFAPPFSDHAAGRLPAQSEDQTQDPHILRAIGRAWAWRRRMEAGEFGTVHDLAQAVGLSERQVSRQLRLAYIAPAVLKRLIYGREPLAITLLRLIDIAILPWHEQEAAAFEDNSD